MLGPVARRDGPPLERDLHARRVLLAQLEVEHLEEGLQAALVRRRVGRRVDDHVARLPREVDVLLDPPHDQPRAHVEGGELVEQRRRVGEGAPLAREHPAQAGGTALGVERRRLRLGLGLYRLGATVGQPRAERQLGLLGARGAREGGGEQTEHAVARARLAREDERVLGHARDGRLGPKAIVLPCTRGSPSGGGWRPYDRTRAGSRSRDALAQGPVGARSAAAVRAITWPDLW